MKILEDNYKKIKHPTYSLHITAKCPSCYSKLEIDSNDIQEDRDGKYIICPCCHMYIAEEALIKCKEQIHTLECDTCSRVNPEMAELCDECKADTLCDAFRRWYNTVYKK